MIRDVYCGSRIRIFCIPDSGIKKSQEHWLKIRENETKMCEPVGLLQLKVNLREMARGARDLQDSEVTLRLQLQLGRLPLLAAQGGRCWLHSLAVQPVLT
jgi:hypothetical protein